MWTSLDFASGVLWSEKPPRRWMRGGQSFIAFESYSNVLFHCESEKSNF